MKTSHYILFVLFLFLNIEALAQQANYLKSASEVRKIILSQFPHKIHQHKLIRSKLDSIGIIKKEYDRFRENLYYVSRNLYTGELQGRGIMVDKLRESKAYRALNNEEIQFLTENFHFYYFLNSKIWNDRYPHGLNKKSKRLKELAQYNIKNGDKVCHFDAPGDHICDLLYLTHDSISLTHSPNPKGMKEVEILNSIVASQDSSSNQFFYALYDELKKEEDGSYDKIIFNGIPLLFYQNKYIIKSRLKRIHKLLKVGGELIMGFNYDLHFFDGHISRIDKLDVKIDIITKQGFKLKKKSYSENEYLVYRFEKVLNK